MPDQITMFDDNPEYAAFVDKFKPKKTTDDCYTPPNVYEAVADWVAREYGRDRSGFVRPFYPGGDYEHFDYPPGCTVVDNPPFSIIAQIARFYCAREIPFFLFAPTLTLFSGRGLDVTYIPCGVTITYDNGANVNTSFVTSLDDCRVRSAPGLYAAVKRENVRNEKAMTKQLPKYVYPDCVLTAAAAYQYSRLGVEYRLEKADCAFISRLDAMKGTKKSGIFGGAFLLSDRAAADRAAADRAAADRAAADRAAATVWQLSPRERRIAEGLNAPHTSAGHEGTGNREQGTGIAEPQTRSGDDQSPCRGGDTKLVLEGDAPPVPVIPSEVEGSSPTPDPFDLEFLMRME